MPQLHAMIFSVKTLILVASESMWRIYTTDFREFYFWNEIYFIARTKETANNIYLFKCLILSFNEPDPMQIGDLLIIWGEWVGWSKIYTVMPFLK